MVIEIEKNLYNYDMKYLIINFSFLITFISFSKEIILKIEVR